jgi:hypothetical protein
VANQSDAARSPASQPHHIGADRSFVDKYQPSGVKHALLPDPASARTGHVRSLPLHGLQAFFEGDAVAGEKPRERIFAGSNAPPA